VAALLPTQHVTPFVDVGTCGKGNSNNGGNKSGNATRTYACPTIGDADVTSDKQSNSKKTQKNNIVAAGAAATLDARAPPPLPPPASAPPVQWGIVGCGDVCEVVRSAEEENEEEEEETNDQRHQSLV
jgi:hypothetical protein